MGRKAQGIRVRLFCGIPDTAQSVEGEITGFCEVTWRHTVEFGHGGPPRRSLLMYQELVRSLQPLLH